MAPAELRWCRRVIISHACTCLEVGRHAVLACGGHHEKAPPASRRPCNGQGSLSIGETKSEGDAKPHGRTAERHMCTQGLEAGFQGQTSQKGASRFMIISSPDRRNRSILAAVPPVARRGKDLQHRCISGRFFVGGGVRGSSRASGADGMS